MDPNNQQPPQQIPPKSDTRRIVGLLLFLAGGSVAIFFGIFGAYIFIADATSDDGAAKGLASLVVLFVIVPIVAVSSLVSVLGHSLYKKHSNPKR